MDTLSSLEQTVAVTSLLFILLTLIGIGLAWWALQQFRFDLFLKNPKSGAAKLLQIMLSIVLGYGAAKFLIDYFQWSTMLKGMF